MVSRTSRRGVPIGDLPDPVAMEVAGDRAHDGARRLWCPDGTEPIGAIGEDLGDVGDRLQVVDQRGPGADTVWRVLTEEPDPVRGHDARERTAAVDRLQERCLLAVEVVVGSFEDGAVDLGWHQFAARISARAARVRRTSAVKEPLRATMTRSAWVARAAMKAPSMTW